MPIEQETGRGPSSHNPASSSSPENLQGSRLERLGKRLKGKAIGLMAAAMLFFSGITSSSSDIFASSPSNPPPQPPGIQQEIIPDNTNPNYILSINNTSSPDQPSQSIITSFDEKPTIKSQELTTQQIFAELTVSLEQLIQNPINIEGFHLVTDDQGEIRAILVNAAKQQQSDEDNRYVTSISTRLPDGRFSKFTPLWNLPKETKPLFVKQTPDEDIMIGIWNTYYPSGFSSYPPISYFVSKDGGKTFVDETFRIGKFRDGDICQLPTNCQNAYDCQNICYAYMSTDPVILQDVFLNFMFGGDRKFENSQEVYSLAFNGFFLRYPDGSIKKVQWGDKHNFTDGLRDLKRVGDTVRGYAKAPNYYLRKFSINNIYNPPQVLNSNLYPIYGGDIEALAVKWGETEEQDRIYTAISGYNVFRVYDSQGNVLKEEYYSQWTGEDSCCMRAIRVVGDEKLFVVINPYIVIRDLSKDITEPGAIVKKPLPNDPNRTDDPYPWVNYQYHVQLGKIGGKWFAFIHSFYSSAPLAILAQEFDPKEMQFRGEPFFIAGGMGEERIFENFLPIIMNQK